MNHDKKNLNPGAAPDGQTGIEPGLEARLVAWVAGEAPAIEIAELERLVAEKPELAIFKRRIEAVHGLVAEALQPEKEPLRLPEARRAELLRMLAENAPPAAPVEEVSCPPPGGSVPRPESPRSSRAPRLYFIMSGLAAACLAVLLFFPRHKLPVHAETAAAGAGRLGVETESRTREVAVMAARETPERAESMARERGAAPLPSPDATAVADDMRAGASRVARTTAPAATAGRPGDAPVELQAFTTSAPEAARTGSATQRRLIPEEAASDTSAGVRPAPASTREIAPAGPARLPPTPAPPAETSARTQPVSTFPLHVSDVSFRLAKNALGRGLLPDASRIRPEEFYNAFDYADSAPAMNEEIGCTIEQAVHPFLPQRNLVRIAVKVPSTNPAAARRARATPPDSPEVADAGFVPLPAGASGPAAGNVTLQVRFNPARVGNYRLIGFDPPPRDDNVRDARVDAAGPGADETVIALYQVEPLPQGTGELGEVFVRFRDAATGGIVGRSWTIGYEAGARAFDRATPSIQLAGTAALFAEKLRGGAPADPIELGDLAGVVNALRSHYAHQPRVQEFVAMFAQMRRISGE